MSDFVQFHLLTAYPPSNLNRDDLGRPKTVVFGGSQRLRVSSQSMKRAWRCSTAFDDALAGHIGTRSRLVETQRVLLPLIAAGISEDVAKGVAANVDLVFRKAHKELGKSADKKKGKPTGKKSDSDAAASDGGAEAAPAGLGQAVHYSVDELARIDQLVARVTKGEELTSADYLKLLDSADHNTVDIALFGRMLASEPKFNVDAAAQVAHAISVHKVAVEDDFFTAVDDLNRHEDDSGAAMMGSVEFAAPVLYQYVCIDRTQLIKNLGGNVALADRAIQALLRCAATVSPTGKQATFASRAFASYLLVERGSGQPRTLAAAFLRPVSGDDQLGSAIHALESTQAAMNRAYGVDPSARSFSVNVPAGSGSLDEASAFLVTA